MAADPDAFQQLSDAELATLGQLGVRRAVAAGEYLYRESDPGYDFYVVLSGAVEIVVNSEGKERVIARHGAGRFLGELNLLTGQRVFVSARVAEAGEVIAVPRDALRRLIATDASLSDKILAAFLARRAILMSGAASYSWSSPLGVIPPVTAVSSPSGIAPSQPAAMPPPVPEPASAIPPVPEPASTVPPPVPEPASTVPPVPEPASTVPPPDPDPASAPVPHRPGRRPAACFRCLG